MTNSPSVLVRAGLAVLALAPAGCMSLQAIEPIIAPPARFQTDTVATVEFVGPAETGSRCAERGATFIGLPAFNAAACASTTLVTMPNPCTASGAGWYAELLCHEIAHVNGWPSDHSAGDSSEPTQPLPLASQSPEAKAFAGSSGLGQVADDAHAGPST